MYRAVLVTKVNNRFICSYIHSSIWEIFGTYYVSKTSVGTEHIAVVKTGLIPVLVELRVEGIATRCVAGVTVYDMMCCVLSCVLFAVKIKCFTDSQRRSRMERILTCFAHWNYREHFHSIISELFDLEILCKVNSVSHCSFWGSLQALSPCISSWCSSVF